ncbi:MAG: DUF4125 family protein [Lachnospiraceae bacterium]
MTTMEGIIKTEWTMFQLVQNEGGPASCQENWTTFQIMRSGQFFCWTEEMKDSYLEDLAAAVQSGWNLIFEKYARMMESTAPEKYQAELAAIMPKRSAERLAMQEKAIAIQVKWLEEFDKAYPHLSGNARVIHTSEDTPMDTSAETYLRGELSTYSDKTAKLYCEYVQQLEKEGKNLTAMINENVMKQYGYADLAEAEAAMSKF